MKKKAHRRGRSRKGGRPRKTKVSTAKIAQLSGFGCTIQEIASFCGVSRDTIERNFATEIQQGRDAGRIRLRMKQREIAYKGKGDSRMCIWLGKQDLDQRDKQEIFEGDDPLKQLLEEFKIEHSRTAS